MAHEAIGKEDWSKVLRNLNDWNFGLILGLPGTGKTNCVKGLRSIGRKGDAPVAADLDIKGLGNDRADINKVPNVKTQMAYLVNACLDDDIKVFTFLKYLNDDALRSKKGALVVIPDARAEDWAKRIQARGDGSAFVNAVRGNIHRWIDDWLRVIPRLQRRMRVCVALCGVDQYMSQVLEALDTNPPVYDSLEDNFDDFYDWFTSTRPGERHGKEVEP